MTYNVLSGTLNLAQLQLNFHELCCVQNATELWQWKKRKNTKTKVWKRMPTPVPPPAPPRMWNCSHWCSTTRAEASMCASFATESSNISRWWGAIYTATRATFSLTPAKSASKRSLSCFNCKSTNAHVWQKNHIPVQCAVRLSPVRSCWEDTSVCMCGKDLSPAVLPVSFEQYTLTRKL